MQSLSDQLAQKASAIGAQRFCTSFWEKRCSVGAPVVGAVVGAVVGTVVGSVVGSVVGDVLLLSVLSVLLDCVGKL